MQLVEPQRSFSSYVVRDCTNKASAEVAVPVTERADESSGDHSLATPVSIAVDSNPTQNDELQVGNGQSASANDEHDGRSSAAEVQESAETTSPAPPPAKSSQPAEASDDAKSQATAVINTVESSAAKTDRAPRKRHKKKKRGRRGQRNKSADSQSSPQNSRPAKDA